MTLKITSSSHPVIPYHYQQPTLKIKAQLERQKELDKINKYKSWIENNLNFLNFIQSFPDEFLEKNIKKNLFKELNNSDLNLKKLIELYSLIINKNKSLEKDKATEQKQGIEKKLLEAFQTFELCEFDLKVKGYNKIKKIIEIVKKMEGVLATYLIHKLEDCSIMSDFLEKLPRFEVKSILEMEEQFLEVVEGCKRYRKNLEILRHPKTSTIDPSVKQIEDIFAKYLINALGSTPLNSKIWKTLEYLDLVMDKKITVLTFNTDMFEYHPKELERLINTFPDIKDLTIFHEGIFHSDFAVLNSQCIKFKKVRKLEISRCLLNKNDMQMLPNFEKLKNLTLWGSPCTNYEHLKEIKKLKYLKIRDSMKSSRFKAKDLIHLKDMSNLECLDLPGTAFWGNEIDEIKNLKNLQNLKKISIKGMSIKRETCNDFLELQSLKEIECGEMTYLKQDFMNLINVPFERINPYVGNLPHFNWLSDL